MVAEERWRGYLFLGCCLSFLALPRRRHRSRRCWCRRNGAPPRARDRRGDESWVVIPGPGACPVGRDDERDDVVEEQAPAGLGALLPPRRRQRRRRFFPRRRRSICCSSCRVHLAASLFPFFILLSDPATDQHAVTDAHGAVRRPRARRRDGGGHGEDWSRARGEGRRGRAWGVVEARPLSTDRVEEASLGDACF